MMGGKQTSFGLSETRKTVRLATVNDQIVVTQRPHALPSRLTVIELEQHEKAVAALGETALWKNERA